MAPIVLYLGGLILRTLVIAVLVWIATLFVRNAAMRHAMWTAVLILMLLLPFVDLALPQTMVPRNVIPNEVLYLSAPQVYYEPAKTLMNATPEPLVPAQIQLNILASRVLGLPLYLLVAGLLMARVAMAFLQVFRLKRSGVAVEIAGVAVDVRTSDRVHVPVTLGFLRPVVVLPADWKSWEEWELRAVLAHELAHVQRRDWAIAVLAAVNKSVFWFNPLSWWLERRISRLSEEAADEVSLNVVGDAPRYAGLLVRFASAQNGRRLFVAHVAMARKKIADRVDRVLALKAPGFGVLPRVAWVVVMLLAMPVLYAAAALHVGPAPIPATLGYIGEVVMQTAPQPAPAPTPAPAPAAQAQPAPQPPEVQIQLPPGAVLPRRESLFQIQVTPPPQNAPVGQNSTSVESSQSATSQSSNTSLNAGARAGFVSAFGGGSSTSAGPNMFCPPAQCSFEVSRVVGRSVTIVGENPGSSSQFSFSCTNNCSYGLGIRPDGTLAFARSEDVAVPGVAFTLSADGASLDIQCKSQRCFVSSTSNSGQATTQAGNIVPILNTNQTALASGQSIAVPVSAQIRFTFSR
jgi:beta-lactamase regulating signal transducer with metallopeptidase domain